MVTKYSEDEEGKQRAGDLGFIDKESTRQPKPVVEAAFKLAEVGDVAAPIKTDKGWVVIRLTQKRPGFNRPLTEVKRQIQQRLFRDMRTKAMDDFVADLKKKSTIEIKDENLAKVVIDTGQRAGGPPGLAGAAAGDVAGRAGRHARGPRLRRQARRPPARFRKASREADARRARCCSCCGSGGAHPRARSRRSPRSSAKTSSSPARWRRRRRR